MLFVNSKQRPVNIPLPHLPSHAMCTHNPGTRSTLSRHRCQALTGPGLIESARRHFRDRTFFAISGPLKKSTRSEVLEVFLVTLGQARSTKLGTYRLVPESVLPNHGGACVLIYTRPLSKGPRGSAVTILQDADFLGVVASRACPPHTRACPIPRFTSTNSHRHEH